VVSFTPRPLYLQGRSPLYPSNRRLGGSQSQSQHGSEDRNSQPLPGLEPPLSQPVAQRCMVLEVPGENFFVPLHCKYGRTFRIIIQSDMKLLASYKYRTDSLRTVYRGCIVSKEIIFNLGRYGIRITSIFRK
jgi:hypothetical protein